jgi:hypothetical protein
MARFSGMTSGPPVPPLGGQQPDEQIRGGAPGDGQSLDRDAGAVKRSRSLTAVAVVLALIVLALVIVLL